MEAASEKGFLTAGKLGLTIGSLPCGSRDSITDVEGVRVGHCTVTDPSHTSVQTGVTVILPHHGNVFREKTVAACHVVNGFGKPMGLTQIAELGQLESPIALTNTLSVPTVADALLDYLLDLNPEIGVATGSVNPVVAECNDWRLNDLRGRHVGRKHVSRAIEAAVSGPVRQGSVGAGRGMSAYGLKGGVGSASRIVALADAEVTVGVLVLSNLGLLAELTIAGRPVGAVLAREREAGRRVGEEDPQAPSAGSIVAVVATDAPVSDRQLARLLRRVQNGIARTGSTTAHGSGEVVIGFTTHFRIPHFPEASRLPLIVLAEDDSHMNGLFQAVTEASEEAILNSLFNAESVTGRSDDMPPDQVFPVARLHELMMKAL